MIYSKDNDLHILTDSFQRLVLSKFIVQSKNKHDLFCPLLPENCVISSTASKIFNFDDIFPRFSHLIEILVRKINDFGDKSINKSFYSFFIYKTCCLRNIFIKFITGSELVYR